MADAKISELTALAGADVVGAADQLVIVDTSAGVTKRIPPNDFVSGMTLTTTATLTAALASYVTSATLTSTLAGYHVKRADGGLTATSTEREHALVLNTAGNDVDQVNVLSLQHAGVDRANAGRFVNRNGFERGAVGQINRTDELTDDPNHAFDSDAYLEGSANVTGGDTVTRMAGVTPAVQTGNFRGVFKTRRRMRFVPKTGEAIIRLPERNAENGAVAFRATARGSVAAGLPSLAAGAGVGFFGLPIIAGTPTGEPEDIPGFVWAAYDIVAHKLWVFERDATKALPIPDWYLALDESTAAAFGDEVYNGASWWATGTLPAVVSPGVTGAGSCRRFNGSTHRVSLLSVDPATALNSSFCISLWLRPQSFAAFGRILSAEALISLTIATSGRLAFEMGNAGAGGSIAASASTQLTLNTWSHVLLWRDDAAKTINLTVDGVNSSASYSGTAALGPHVLTLGSYSDSAIQFYNGDMDEVAYFSSALTSALRTTLYNAGAGRFFRWDVTNWTAPSGGSGTWRSVTLS